MRQLFSEFIFAKSAYETDTIQKSSSQDYICREYNNKFAMWTDTHMSKHGDEWVITGNMIRWKDKLYMMYGFFNTNGLTWNEGMMNRDNVIYVKNCEVGFPVSCPDCKVCSYNEGLSRIPKPLSSLTTNGDINKIYECLRSNDAIKALNESPYVRGNEWSYNNNMIMGVVGGKMVYINTLVNESTQPKDTTLRIGYLSNEGVYIVLCGCEFSLNDNKSFNFAKDYIKRSSPKYFKNWMSSLDGVKKELNYLYDANDDDVVIFTYSPQFDTLSAHKFDEIEVIE